jgi:hypothetical protein
MAGKEVEDIDLPHSMEQKVPTHPQQEEPDCPELQADDSASEQR